MNTSTDLVIVDNISIVVKCVNALMILKEKARGAPIIPVKGFVQLDNKVGAYNINFEYKNEKIQRFSYSHNQLDNMFVEIKGKGGYIYECYISVSYFFTQEYNTQHILISDVFTLSYPFTSATKIVERLSE